MRMWERQKYCLVWHIGSCNGNRNWKRKRLNHIQKSKFRFGGLFLTTLVPETGAVEEYTRYKVASALYEMYNVMCED